MSLDSPRSKHSKQSAVRSLKHAWNNFAKKNRVSGKQDDPFASTWFLVDEEATNKNREHLFDSALQTLVSPSVESFKEVLSTLPEFPLPPTTENPDELASFLPSFESPPSSPISAHSPIIPYPDDDRLLHMGHSIPEANSPAGRSSSDALSINFLDTSSDYSSSFSYESSSSPDHSIYSPRDHSNKKTHRPRPSLDVRMVSDFGPASVHCWRPLSWNDLLRVVSLRTRRPKEEIAFVCQNYPRVISNPEEYDAMIAWLSASTNAPNPQIDIWVVKKSLTSGRMHLGSPRVPSFESLHTSPPSPQTNKRLRRAATTLISRPTISQDPPLSWKLGMGSAESSGRPSPDSKFRGWI